MRGHRAVSGGEEAGVSLHLKGGTDPDESTVICGKPTPPREGIAGSSCRPDHPGGRHASPALHHDPSGLHRFGAASFQDADACTTGLLPHPALDGPGGPVGNRPAGVKDRHISSTALLPDPVPESEGQLHPGRTPPYHHRGPGMVEPRPIRHPVDEPRHGPGGYGVLGHARDVGPGHRGPDVQRHDLEIQDRAVGEPEPAFPGIDPHRSTEDRGDAGPGRQLLHRQPGFPRCVPASDHPGNHAGVEALRVGGDQEGSLGQVRTAPECLQDEEVGVPGTQQEQFEGSLGRHDRGSGVVVTRVESPAPGHGFRRWGGFCVGQGRLGPLIGGLCLALLLVVQGAGPALGQRKSPAGGTRVSLLLDNDTFTHTDRSYTGGLSLGWAWPASSQDSRTHWLGPLVPGDAPSFRASFSLEVGQKLYTPADLREPALIRDDRPYAAVLFASAAAIVATRRRQRSVDITLGLVGPAALGEATQSLIHRVTGSPLARGWRHQLGNEPLVNVGVEERWRFRRRAGPGGLAVDLVPRYGMALGNLQAWVGVGAEVRFGWGLPADFGRASLRPGGFRGPTLDGPSSPGVYLFASTDGKLVARNLLIDGNTFRESHGIRRAPFTSGSVAGIRAVLGRWSVRVEQVFWSRRFVTERRHHSFSVLTFSRVF